jgi:hypothetical protein
LEKIRLEPKIKNLVEALWLWKIETFQSCEGHEKWKEHFPWIIIDVQDLEKVQKLAYWYNNNKAGEIHWKADPYLSKSNCILLMPIENNASLEKLQKSALEFAEEIKKLKELPDINMSSNAYC